LRAIRDDDDFLMWRRMLRRYHDKRGRRTKRAYSRKRYLGILKGIWMN
jgi:hypothetical protein